MKITLLAALVLLLSFIVTNPLIDVIASPPEEVVDTSGKTLRVGSYYYLIQAPQPKNGTGPGLGFAGECPVRIEAPDGFGGDSLSFIPYNFKKLSSVVRVSTDVNVVFSGEVGCYHSNVWKMDYDASNRKWFVSTGGDIGNPGPKTVRSWFKIEKYEEYYKMVYCPSVCKSCKVLCEDIGIVKDKDGTNRLALSDKPYKIQFRKD